MKITKRQLEAIILQEIRSAIHEQDDYGGSQLFSRWGQWFNSPWRTFVTNFTQGLRSSSDDYGYYNTNGSVPDATTGDPSANPSSPSTNETRRVTYVFYFNSQTTAQEISRANITTLIQRQLRAIADRINVNTLVQNLQTTYANSGYPPNYNWNQYANQLKEAYKNSIRVGIPNIQQNENQTVASFSVEMMRSNIFEQPNSVLPREEQVIQQLRNQVNTAVPNKLLDPANSPNRRNPDIRTTSS